MKVKFSWVLAWIIASVVLMYAGLFVCIVLGMQFGEWLLLTSVVMIPATLWLAEYEED